MSGTGSRGYDSVPEMLSDAQDISTAAKEHRRKIVIALNGVLKGKFNCTILVPVTASATTTTIVDPRISYYSFLAPMAFDANGAADIAAGIYFENFTSGSVDMRHRSNGSTRSLLILILG